MGGALVADALVDEEEDGHVEHGDELECDAAGEGALAADPVDENEGAEKGGDELDESEDGGGEELLLLAGGAHHGKVLRRVN